MIKRTQLPMPLNDTYFEPSDWQMSNGILYVSILTAADQADTRLSDCKFVAKTATGEIRGGFKYVSDVIIMLTKEGYAIVWQLARGEQIEYVSRHDDG